VKNSKDLIQNLLEAIEPGGYGFTKTIIYILKHEKNMVFTKYILYSVFSKILTFIYIYYL